MGLVLKTCSFLVGVTVFIATVVSTARAELGRCQQLMGRCDYYLCLEEEIGCGPRGYFKDFAYPYCNKYKNSELLFSSKGKKFLQFVRPCLQDQMNSYLSNLVLEGNQNKVEFCSELKSFAIDSHVTCYEQGHFCGLGIFEKLKVEGLAAEQIFDPEIQVFAAKINQCF